MLRKLAASAAIVTTALVVAVGPAHAGASRSVAVKNNSFAPTSLKIKKGTKVVWTWTQGGVPHNVTQTGGGAASKTTSTKGFKYSRTFKKAGTYHFICTVHPTQMKLTVKVS